jgi:hypothetical protein
MPYVFHAEKSFPHDCNVADIFLALKTYTTIITAIHTILPYFLHIIMVSGNKP